MKSVILAGGFGTRLRSVVSDVPKPLAPIAARPFLAWLIDSLAAQGVTHVTLSVHHQWEKIRDYFDANPAPVPIEYAVEPTALGTGGAIKFALGTSTEPTLVLNGDSFVKADLRALYSQHRQNNAALSMVLRKVPDSGRYGTVETRGDIITAFGEGKAGAPGLINAGVYVLNPALFPPTLPDAFSFERDYLPPRLGTLQPRAFIAEDYFIDIGIPEDYARAQTELPVILKA